MSMAMSEIIKKLEDLASYCDSMVDKEEPECIWKADVEALDHVIKKLSCECSGMDAAEIIRNILDKEQMNQTDLADKMGITRQNISQMLNRNKASMRFDSFSKMVEALEYEIVVRKK